MKRLIAALCLAFLALTASACSEVSGITDKEIGEVNANLRFFKHPTSGLCFAIVSYQQGVYQGGPLMTEVPCEKVEHLLANK